MQEERNKKRKFKRRIRDVEGKKRVRGSEGGRIAVSLDIHLAKMTARLVD